MAGKQPAAVVGISNKIEKRRIAFQKKSLPKLKKGLFLCLGKRGKGWGGGPKEKAYSDHCPENAGRRDDSKKRENENLQNSCSESEGRQKTVKGKEG